MKIHRIVMALALAALTAACSMNSNVNWTYDHSDRYSVGDAVITQPVSSISLNWVGGWVQISQTDRTDISIREEICDKLGTPLDTVSDTLRVHHYVDEDGKLDIQLCMSRKDKTFDLSNLRKSLYIELPSSVSLDEIDINAVDADVAIDHVPCRKLSVDGVKTNVNFIVETLPDEIDVNGVDGLLAIQTLPTAGLTIDMEGLGNHLSCRLPSEKKDGKTVVGDGKCKVDFDGVGCELSIWGNQKKLE